MRLSLQNVSPGLVPPSPPGNRALHLDAPSPGSPSGSGLPIHESGRKSRGGRQRRHTAELQPPPAGLRPRCWAHPGVPLPLRDAMGQEEGGHASPCHPTLAHKVLRAPRLEWWDAQEDFRT